MSRARDFANLAGAAGAGTITGESFIINGDMAVWQRGTSFADPSNGSYLCDRVFAFNNNDGAITFSQSTDVPSGQGFKYSLKGDVTSEDTSIAAGQYVSIDQYIEGQNTISLDWGSSDAKYVTISFWIKSNLTGTYCYSIRNSAINRSFIKEFTIDTADTWEHKTITIAGDTGGTWLTTNAIGQRHQISFAMGSTFQGTADSWQTTNVVATSNQENILSSTDNEFYLTGWKVEEGTTATPFQHESFADNLRKCQRYFCKSYDQEYFAGSTFQLGAIYHRNMGSSVSNRAVSVQFPVTMRDNPTVTLYSLNGTSGNVSDCNTGYTHSADDTASINGTIGETGFSKLTNISNADMLAFHYTAEIEL
jgi:hypothetical protein